MSFRNDFNLFVGAKYGIFKGVKATEGAVVAKSIQSLNHLSKGTDITALAWNNQDEEEILIGLSNQLVKIYDTNAKVFTLSLDAKPSSEESACAGDICGLLRFDGIVVTAMESGHVRLLKYGDDNSSNIYAGGPISKMRRSTCCPSTIGTGGLENELKLWDLRTGKNTFTAKNVPNDSLQLRVKVWVTDHVFMPSSENVVVGSKYGYVRMYDPRAQRRPVVKVDMPEKAVTCIASSNQENTVLCGLAKGDIVAVDMRMGQTSKNYKGFVGAVKDIVCHPTEPYVASVGLDRFLRVHDVNSKKLLMKEYMVSRMNCLLMRSNFSLKTSNPEPEKKAKKRVSSNVLLSDGTSDNDEAHQFDEMFNSMEEVVDGSSKKAQAVGETSETPSKKRKSQLFVNPFANKSSKSSPVKETCNSKKSPKKQMDESQKEIVQEDSDDDIMIVSETVGNTQSSNDSGDDDGGEESEVDEAEGESDEFDESSDFQDKSGEDEASTRSKLDKIGNLKR